MVGMKRRSRQEFGRIGEAFALKHLTELGYRLIEKNHRRGRSGEADLILLDDETLVFCEVKTRSDRGAGAAVESYSRRQQSRMRRLVLDYLRRTNWSGPLRVDLLGLEPAADGSYEVQHIRNAIELDDNW